MQYNKEKKGRLLGTNRSPRDLQNKNLRSREQLIEDLISRNSRLSDELVKLRSGDLIGNLDQTVYSEDEFNEELVKALDRETLVYKTKIHNLEKELASMEALAKARQEIIDTLRSKEVVVGESAVDKNIKPPEMDEIVIDPSEKIEMEPHIKVKSDRGCNQSDKLAKLKKLGIGG